MNVRTLCLGILSIQEASGYEVKKEVEEGRFGHFIDASFGSIYPALTQLNAEGLVEVREEEQSGRPDRKVYSITEKGRLELVKNLSVVAAKDKYRSEFLFEMLLQHLLSKNQIDSAISKQHGDLTEKLERIAEAKANANGKCNDPGSRFVMGYGECVLSSALHYLEQHAPWLKQAKSKLTPRAAE